MKINSKIVSKEREHSSVICFQRREKKFDFNWHFHAEFELTYIVKGSGTRLVGDHMTDYKEGDLVFLGSNLPHTWTSSDQLGFNGESKNEAIVIQFDQSIFGGELLGLKEFESIRTLFLKSDRGVQFFGTLSKVIGDQIIGLKEVKGFDRWNQLLSILNTLGNAEEHQFLASPIYALSSARKLDNRIDNICQYIHKHFTRTINLTEMAALAKMAEPSFCRYFKRMLGKSFSNYLMDLRVGRACKLLEQSAKPISEIAIDSGFNSLTHFNRTFLKNKKQSPRDYRKGIQKLP